MFVGADLGWRDEWLLGDGIKRGHRWSCPSVNVFPAVSHLSLLVRPKSDAMVETEAKARAAFLPLLNPNPNPNSIHEPFIAF